MSIIVHATAATRSVATAVRDAVREQGSAVPVTIETMEERVAPGARSSVALGIIVNDSMRRVTLGALAGIAGALALSRACCAAWRTAWP